MRLHYVLNHGGTPESKLADIEIHFEASEGLLSGTKLVGCSIWKSKKGEAPTVLVPSRSYATAGGIRYFELLRPSEEDPTKAGSGETAEAKKTIARLKAYLRDEYLKIADLPEPRVESDRAAGVEST